MGEIPTTPWKSLGYQAAPRLLRRPTPDAAPERKHGQRAESRLKRQGYEAPLAITWCGHKSCGHDFWGDCDAQDEPLELGHVLQVHQRLRMDNAASGRRLRPTTNLAAWDRLAQYVGFQLPSMRMG